MLTPGNGAVRFLDVQSWPVFHETVQRLTEHLA